MKGILLAGGSGSRLLPLTTVVNKHLLPVGQKPMIFYPIEKLIGAGITDILIVTGTEHMGSIVQTLGSGKEFGGTFTYKVQDAAGGIAQALGLARGFCYGERLCVVLGDNIFEDDLSFWVNDFNKQERGARIILKLLPNLDRFGIAVIDKNKRIREIVEKPAAATLNRIRDNKEYDNCYAVTGIYFYDQRVFDIIDTLNPSNRGELEITDVNNRYLEWGELQYSIMEKWWNDCGTFESLHISNELIRTHSEK